MAGVQVLRKFSEVHLVTWESALRNIVPWEAVDEWIAAKSPTGQFMAAVMAKGILYDKVRIVLCMRRLHVHLCKPHISVRCTSGHFHVQCRAHNRGDQACKTAMNAEDNVITLL